ncbi:MAG: alpha-amylase family glycosyl hydrolase [Anaerolineales bacterium]
MTITPTFSMSTKQAEWNARHSQKSLERLLPRLQDTFSDYSARHPTDWEGFVERVNSEFDRLFGLLHSLYGNHYDFFYYLEDLLNLLARSWSSRSRKLKQLDAQRLSDPLWYQSHKMLGGVYYVDLYAGDINGIRSKIPYFKELGLTYLHLMPLFKMPTGENDGGYAVSSYREVDPRIGSMPQLRKLAQELHAEGISLVLDLVFNHTSDEHDWVQRAKAGDQDFQDYYYVFPDETLPQAYQRTLREIFPEQRPGSFTFDETLKKWVWTTFNSYQWDLNYSNPAVFNQMASEILFLANIGVDILRLDAVAFTWKIMGTGCENLPEAHQLIQAFNAVVRIAAPALLFKSEAIVHPDEVIKYISLDECQLSYNPLLMAMLWNSLATRDIRMLRISLAERFQLPSGCEWVNYVRCHDDIGWTFADEDAERLGINPYFHRKFLNEFYTGRFPGSFGRGLPFQENVKTGDMRVSGTCASLAGLEKALNQETSQEVELAIRRILLIHAVILTIGGIPLIYLGDEIGTLNDYNYRNDLAKAKDSRWVHRPKINWAKMEKRHDPESLEGKIFSRLHDLIQLRKDHPVFSNSKMHVMDTDSDQVLGFIREYDGQKCLVFANFSEQPQKISANVLRLYGMAYTFTDLMSGEAHTLDDLELGPFDARFLMS